MLMKLCKQSGVKNVIYQLLAPNITINLDEVEENRSYAVVIDKGIRYCLTGNPGTFMKYADRLRNLQIGNIKNQKRC